MKAMAYTAYWIGHTAIRLATLTLLFVVVVVPPLLVRWMFPLVSSWWAEQDSALLGHAGFMALIGVLGLIPYLFTKSADKIPGAIKRIANEATAVMREPWLPDSDRTGPLSAVIRGRARGLRNALWASWSLFAALATSAAIVLVAATLVAPPVAHVSIETQFDAVDGETHTQRDVYRLVSGDEMTVHVSCASESEDRCTPIVQPVIVGPLVPFSE